MLLLLQPNVYVFGHTILVSYFNCNTHSTIPIYIYMLSLTPSNSLSLMPSTNTMISKRNQTRFIILRVMYLKNYVFYMVLLLEYLTGYSLQSFIQFCILSRFQIGQIIRSQSTFLMLIVIILKSILLFIKLDFIRTACYI